MSARELVPKNPDPLSKNRLEGTFPALLVRAGRAACFAADEFFSARISNPHTHRAYARAVGQFLTWCEGQGLELRQVTPGQAGRFLEQLPGGAATKNQALAVFRHFFDALVARHAAVLNPFQSVRGARIRSARAERPRSPSAKPGDFSPPSTPVMSSAFGTGRSWGHSVLGTLTYTEPIHLSSRIPSACLAWDSLLFSMTIEDLDAPEKCGSH